MSGESRQELISWLNDLLQLQYTKIEQVGSGAALCQIFDSIYGDVHLNKVKFNAYQEYEFVNNFKVLQKTFNDHQVDKVIPVERLIKCRFQDNLEFLQWVKKYWDMYYPGGHYDAIARRKSNSASKAVSNPVTLKKTSSNNSIEHNNRANVAQQRSVFKAESAHKSAANARNVSVVGVDSSVRSTDLDRQITQLQVTVDGLEKERDFYFGKLRDVEVLIQSRLDSDADERVATLCKEIQAILYSTEEGFEIPQENQEPVANTEQEIY